MDIKKKWPYIVGSIVLIGASILLRKKAKNMRLRAESESEPSLGTAP